MEKNLSSAQIKALDFERRGVKMYLEAAKKTTNPLARRLFYSLAKEEIDHMTFIEDLKGEDLNVEEEIIESRIKEIFFSLEEREIKRDSDNVEALEGAIKMEEKGKLMYMELRDNSTTEEEKTFYSKMVEEEDHHLSSLQNVHSYLTDSADWFHSTESSTWNWMNI